MSFFLGFLAMNCHIRSASCDTAARLCVRTVLWPPGFSLVPAIRASRSASARAALFPGLMATMAESDSFGSCISSLGFYLSLHGPGDDPPGRPEGLPGPNLCRTYVPGFLNAAESSRP